MGEGSIRVGIGGWSYPPWRRAFYPATLPQAKELEFASRQFRTIEINATFYGRQSSKSWLSWAKTAPEGFEFAIKGSRFVVTRPRLADAKEAVDTYFAQGMAALGSKLGPILWMFAARRRFDAEDVAAFLNLLPTKLEGTPLRHVLEPRHESFRDERFFALCRDHDVAVVFGDDDEFPCIDADTATFAYARLQRMREAMPSGYDNEALEAFAVRARRWSVAGKDSYIFMINGAKIRAPAAALALQDMLSR